MRTAKRHDAQKLVAVEVRPVGERIAHQRGKVDRAQQARAIGRQRLLAAIVNIKPIGIERVGAGDLRVEHFGIAVGLDSGDLGDEPLAIRRTPIGCRDRFETRALFGIGEADPLGEDADIVVGDRQLMIGVAVVGTAAALGVREEARSCRAPLAIDR